MKPLLIFLSAALLFSCSKSDREESNACTGINIQLSASATPATAGQNNGSIQVMATGSTNLTFSVNNGAFQASPSFQNLAPGNYTVTAKNSDGCTGNTTVTITQNAGSSKTELLIAKKWKISAMTSQLSTGQVIESYSTLSHYDKDDYFVFNATGTYEWNANTQKLPGNNDPIVDAGTWKLLNSESDIELKSNNSRISYALFKIKELAANKLTIETKDIYNGTGNTVWITYIPL